MTLRTMHGLAVCAVLGLLTLAASAKSPFAARMEPGRLDDRPVAHVTVDVPKGHFVYVESIEAQAADRSLSPEQAPAPVAHKDPFSGENTQVYDETVTLTYAMPADAEALTFTFQGCNDSVCFFPETHTFSVESIDPPSSAEPDAVPASPVFRERDAAAGYLAPDEFLAWLDAVEGKAVDAGHGLSGRLLAFARDPLSFYRASGLWLTAVLIVLGGLLLNLTPCVLPMIPINIAILGAGANASSRMRGFLLGGTYGLAIALVYGALGLFVVLTGSQFGALNASPWFNAAIAILFVVLALAMFDIVAIDFSRFQKAGGGRGRSPFFAAFSMGAVSALLAGACVAPVVIAVLILAGNLYGQGVGGGLLLPFLLGAGMALPWPFAGAGLSFLPKPGGWMVKVKYAFGVFILLMAVYYAHLAWTLGRGAPATPASEETSARVVRVNAEDPAALDAVLQQAFAQGRPVLLDFWATWCKNCLAMEKTTFKDPEVLRRLEPYVFIKVQAEQPSRPPTRDVLERYGVQGLPTYVALKP